MIFSVAQLNEYVRGILSRDDVLQCLQLRGEISGFRAYASGHWYFALKDQDASVRCVMFRQSAAGARFTPQDGLRVVLSGQATLYTREGAFQFVADKMTADGEGALYQAFLQLCDRLRAEGLFAEDRKVPLPALPRTLGVVTSPSGAVIRDIVNVARRRDRGINILLAPVHVQGEGAAAEIAAGVQTLDRSGLCDVIIVGRGGGSIEDLWPFNEEAVARAVAACQTPIVSAVGHETDTTICDFAADLRAPTPSAAAELCVPLADQLRQAADELRMRLTRAAQEDLRRRKQGLLLTARHLAALHPGARMAAARARLFSLYALLPLHMKARLAAGQGRLAAASSRLTALGPRSVLQRGYALVEAAGGLRTSAAQLRAGEEIRVVMRDGSVHARAVTVCLKENEHEA